MRHWTITTAAGVCAAIALGIVAAGTTACSSQAQPQAKPTTTETPAAQGDVKRYDLAGKVVAVDKAAKKLTVDHGAIPGFMGAMTMSYAVKDAQLLDNVAVGDQVTAQVVSTGGEYWLENVAKAAAPAPK